MIVVIIVAALGILYLCAGMICFFMAAVRKRETEYKGRESLEYLGCEKWSDAMTDGISWIFEQKKLQLTMKSRDGLTLYADYIENDGSDKTVLLFHGYRSKPFIDFSCITRKYYEMGFNIILVHQRSHCKSEGKYITFGLKERFDCADWAEYAAKRFGNDQSLYLQGMSMGASTVLMAGGLALPENVRGIIADCGFTSPREIIKITMKKRIKQLTCIMMPVTAALFGIFTGCSVNEYSTTEALEHCKTPILLIHGKNDGFVPCYMTLKNYNAAKCEKEMLLIDGADHGQSYLVNREAVEKALYDFLEKTLPEKTA